MNEPSELQTEEVETLEQESQEKPKVPDGFVTKEQNNEEVGKQHRLRKKAENEAAAAREEAERIRKERDELREKSLKVEIPPIPDQLDDGYEEKIRVRDEAIQRQAAHDHAAKEKEAAQVRAAERAKADQEAALLEKVRGFDTNTIQLGLSPAEVKKAADSVIELGMNDNLQDILLEDPEGPLMVTYLASNPVEMDSMNTMTPYQLIGAMTELKAKASVLKPKTSQAPEPPEILDGGGAGEIEDPALKGVIFD